MIRSALMALVFVTLAVPFAMAHNKPYPEFQDRDVARLSAKLNGYPGPARVLEPEAELLAELTASSAALRADLGEFCLAAYLETKPLLTRHQIMMYEKCRGDASEHGSGGHGALGVHLKESRNDQF